MLNKAEVLTKSALLLHQLSNALGHVTTHLTARSSRIRGEADFLQCSATDETPPLESSVVWAGTALAD